MAKHKLDDLSFEPEIEGFGLFSSLTESRLCYELNDGLNLKLVRQKQDYALNRAGVVYTFSTYGYYNESQDIRWGLVKNKARNNQENQYGPQSLFKVIEESTSWIKSKNRFDFILWIESNDDLYDAFSALKTEIKNLAFLSAWKNLTETQKNQLIRNTQPTNVHRQS